MKKNNFVEGTIIATAIIVIVKLLGMLYVIPFYAIVGTKGGALYSYAYNIYLIFLGISSAGLPDAVAKIISEYNALGYEDAKQRAYKIGRNLISIIAITSFLVLFIFAEEIGMFIIKDLKGGNTAQDVAFVIRCLSPSVLLVPFLSITKGYLQGHKFISASSLSQLYEQVIRIFIILVGSYLVLKVFNGSLSLAVGVAVSGAFFGGLVAYLYLKHVMKKNNLIHEVDEEDKITDREIVKKIITYAVPFVIISIFVNIYNETDQILVLRTLGDMLKYPTEEVETIASSISTWSPKICMVINAMAMGMTMSLVPTIVSAFARRDYKDVESKINKSLSMIIFISLPMSIGLSILARPVWTMFYGASDIGSTILKLTAFSALFGNLYMIVSAICQSLNKYKAVYMVSGIGFLLNAALDVPIMLLYNKIRIPTYLGSITASIIGYSTSIIIGLILLRQDGKYSYKQAVINGFKTLVPAISMLVVLLVMNHFITLNESIRPTALIKIVIDTVVGGFIYVTVAFKTGLIEEVLGRQMLARLLKKFTFGLVKLKEVE